MKTSSISIVLLSIIFFSGNLFSQNYLQKNDSYLSKLRQIATFKDNPDWITVKSEKSINAKRIFEFYKDAFGLGKSDNMKLVETKTDKLGFTNYRFQQYYKGIPVEGALYIVHEKNGKAVKANGRPVRNLEISNIPLVSSQNAVNTAISFVNASQYMWENPETEKMLKEIKGNEAATYYPKAKLVYMDKKFSQDPTAYKLAFKTEVYSQIPSKRMFIYIDAETGNVLHSINMIQNTDKTVIAPTKYNSNRSIVIDSINPNSYRLREAGRGNGVRTFDLHNTTNYSLATDIIDTDTIFSNDDIANNAHWAAEMTYDYFLQKHARNSYNDAGGALLSYVHFDVNLANAQWDGLRMSYGDGNGTTMSAFTTIDICGHEISHGVTEYAANLVYQDEPGAMNEAFSDIFGTCIEFFADSTPNWLMGEDIGDPIRSMSDPKLYQQPNTYHGQYWDPDPNNFDNGGVHTNSGVLNYWFYLLSAGGSGTNDNGNAYHINAIGMDTAAAIAYRMLTVYLIESSQYMDAYNAGLNAASDLYGSCSNVEKEVAAAFAAVGLGYPISNDKVYLTDVFSPITKCGLSTEQLKIKLLYNGCNSGLPTGDTVLVAFRLDNGIMNYDTLILSNAWNGGDTLSYTVPQTLNITTVGQHKVDVWVKYLTDSAFTYNDSIKNYYFDNLLQQNIDFGMAKITSPHSGCGLSANEIVQAKFIFFGCDSFPAGDTIALAYSINNGTGVYENYITQSTIYSGDTVTYSFTTPADLSAIHGTLHIDAWTDYNVDSLTTNDAVSYTLANPISLRDETVTFDLLTATNYYYVNTTAFSRAFKSIAAHHTGPYGLQMTGGNPMLYINQLQFPDGMNTWTVNEFLSAKANFCVDATGWTNATLKFDLKQTHGGILYSQYLQDTITDFSKASNLRILVNGQQIGDTYNPTTPSSDPWVTYTVNLNQFAGSEFVITIETRNIGKDTLIYKLDNAYIDNVVFKLNCTTAPIPSFTSSANNLTVNFVNPTQDAISYLWKFGDGTTSVLQSPQHTYGTAGIYNVKLYATNSCGTDSFAVLTNVTCNIPQSFFTSIANSLTVNFSNQSQNAMFYLWNFGDGDTTSVFNPQHIFDTTGTYLVTLYAYNNCGFDSVVISTPVVNGIDEHNMSQLQVYPNPAKNKLYVNFNENPSNQSQSVSIQLIDISGKIIYSDKCQTHGVFTLPLKNISSGMYMLEISGQAETKRMKIRIE